jgi:serine/threonine protein kinase
MLGLFKALERVHALGYIHLDVKPGNLLFDLKTKHLRLADFGLARTARDASGCQYGTSGYRSPDNLLNKPTYASSDVWAAGIVLLAFLTQRERVWLLTDGKMRELYNVIALCGSIAVAEFAGTTCSFNAVGSNAEYVVEPARWDEVTQPSVRLAWQEGVHAALTTLAQNCLRVRPTSRWTAAQCIEALQKLYR